jgi:hypothetical protein
MSHSGRVTAGCLHYGERHAAHLMNKKASVTYHIDQSEQQHAFQIAGA